MGFITDSMVQQLGQIGQPKTTTSTGTSTTTQNEPLNFANMAIMALMLMEQYAKKGTDLSGAGVAPAAVPQGMSDIQIPGMLGTTQPVSRAPLQNNVTSQAPGNMTDMNPLEAFTFFQKMFGRG